MSSFYTFDYAWRPCRSPGAHADLVSGSKMLKEANIIKSAEQQQAVVAKDVNALTYERRTAIRTLLYGTIEDQDLRNAFDMVLLPPPYFQEDLHTHPVTRADIVRAVQQIPPDMDATVVFIPFNLCLCIGSYDARLRVAMRRLCEILCVPWSLVERREVMFSNLELVPGEGDELTAVLQEKQEDVSATRQQKKYSVKRVATVGAFAVVGGVALAVTGGLAAPLIAPAFAGLVTATTATIGAVGAVGTAILGSSVVAGVFSGIIAGMTHVAAMAALLTPVLTTASVTAIFGIGGAGLAGYKGLRRTADPDVFVIRSTKEIEELAPLIPEIEDTESSSFTNAARILREGTASGTTPTQQGQPLPDGTGGDGAGAGSTSAQAQPSSPSAEAAAKAANMMEEDEDADSNGSEYGGTFFESKSLEGIVVPAYTRSVSLMNVMSGSLYQRRRCALPFAIECQLPNMQMELKALRLYSGVWGNIPPKTIPYGYAGVAGCANRFAHPTGTSCVVVYELQKLNPQVLKRYGGAATKPSRPASPSPAKGKNAPNAKDSEADEDWVDIDALCGLKFWVLFEKSFIGKRHISFLLQAKNSQTPPSEMTRRLEERSVTSDETAVVENRLMVQARFTPKSYVVLRGIPKSTEPSSGAGGGLSRPTGPAYFPTRELSQRITDTMARVDCRRVIGVALLNHSKHFVKVSSSTLSNGVLSPFTPEPKMVPTDRGTFTVFTNSGMSLQGAEGCFIIKVVNTNEEVPPTATSEQQQSNIAEAAAPRTGEKQGTEPTVSATTESKAETGDAPGKIKVPVPQKKYYIKLGFEVSALNNINVDCIGVGESYAEALAAPLTLTKHEPKKSVAVSLPEGLFFACSFRVDPERNVVMLDFADDLQRCVLEAQQRIALCIGISGFTTIFDPRRLQQDQQVALWQPVLQNSTIPLFSNCDPYAVHWEDEFQRRFSETVGVDSESAANMVVGKAISKAQGIAKKQIMTGAIFMGLRALDTLKGTISLPLYAVWASDLIDNAFATLNHRAVFAGKDLAAALLSPMRGHRPVTLVAFSFGARVVSECLQELYRVKAFGIVENVYLLGATISAEHEVWNIMRSIVPGRLVNVYTRSDWLLWLMFKANEGEIKPMAGISRINIPGVENLDVTSLIDNHAQYALKLNSILRSIPEIPTDATWQPEEEAVSSGAIVSAGECAVCMRRILRAMGSPLSTAEYAALSVTNRIAADPGQCSPDMYYVGHLLHDCMFDFMPPALVQPSQSGVWGIIAEEREGAWIPGNEKEDPLLCGGVIAYAVDLNPLSNTTLLIFTLFCLGGGKADGVVSAGGVASPEETAAAMDADNEGTSSQPIVPLACISKPLTVAFSDEEDRDARQRRLLELLKNEGSSMERIALRCRGAGISPETKTRFVTCNVPVSVKRSDSTSATGDESQGSSSVNAAIDFPVHVYTTVKEERCGASTVLALLSKSATNSERSAFDETAFDKSHAAMIAAIKGMSSPPTVAKVFPLPEMQQRMMALVAERNSATQKAELQRTTEFTVGSVETQNMTVLQPIVFVNCGEEPLYYHLELVEDESNGSNAATPNEEKKSTTASIITESSSWVAVPPSCIPSNHCAMALMRWMPYSSQGSGIPQPSDSEGVPSIRSKEEVLSFFSLDSTSSNYTVLIKGKVSACDPVATQQQSMDASMKVLCSKAMKALKVEKSKTAANSRQGKQAFSSAADNEEVSVSTVKVEGTTFVLVMMSPKVASQESDSDADTNVSSSIPNPSNEPTSGWTFF